MRAALQNYQARMQRALDHIDRHLEDDLDLEAMSSFLGRGKAACRRIVYPRVSPISDKLDRVEKGEPLRPAWLTVLTICSFERMMMR